MGRKTYESIGKPLPNRTTIVITRQTDFQAEGTIIAHSVDEAILKAKSLSREDIFIVGGAEIYTVSMALADQILLTQLHDIFEGDAFFPEISPETWEIVDRERGLTDEKNPFQYSFITYQKKDGTENWPKRSADFNRSLFSVFTRSKVGRHLPVHRYHPEQKHGKIRPKT